MPRDQRSGSPGRHDGIPGIHPGRPLRRDRSVKRGDLVTIAQKGDYERKPRPAVVIQSDFFDAMDSVTVCLLTGERTEIATIRPALEPDEMNSLRERSWVQVDKIATIRRERVGKIFGRVSDTDMKRITASVAVFLGIA
ncbi:type II toxin-antitoxin system PemK/MazF family toxin [Azospirillum doebereinerae]|uniref:type II toxin-antitoxin system PemK/MazF family toxin n=1 Tax=Azospirillum doebereinerae TaxID=92933 RepID=UPI003084342A